MLLTLVGGEVEMFDTLKSKGYQVEFHSHAQAILGVDFPEAVGELEKALLEQSLPIEEIIDQAEGRRRVLNDLDGT